MSIGFAEEDRRKIIEWIAQQGVSTILLCLILGFIGYAIVVLVPQHIAIIQAGYEKNAAALEKSMEKMAESHDRDREWYAKMLEYSDGRRVGGTN